RSAALPRSDQAPGRAGPRADGNGGGGVHQPQPHLRHDQLRRRQRERRCLRRDDDERACVEDPGPCGRLADSRRRPVRRQHRRRRRLDGTRRGQSVRPVVLPDRRADAPRDASERRRHGGAEAHQGQHGGEAPPETERRAELQRQLLRPHRSRRVRGRDDVCRRGHAVRRLHRERREVTVPGAAAFRLLVAHVLSCNFRLQAEPLEAESRKPKAESCMLHAFRRNSVSLAAALFTLIASAQAQSGPSTKYVVRRVEQYVASYGEKASIVVCTERYAQDTSRSADDRRETRTLTSDFAIVKADAIRGWLGFRDVLEVDGKPVADRDDRLVRVLMAAEGRYDEARRLSDESARYNIGAVERNFNVPTAALFFFVPDNHDRFKFSSRGVAHDGTWEIAFSEKPGSALIHSPDWRAIPVSGIIQVLPQNGVVVRTMLKV